MFSYYGSKSKLVNLYPAPKYDKIIEPFAGSARYSLRYWDRDVLLVDKYDVIIKVWHYLQQASPGDILGLPQLKAGMIIDSLNLSKEEKLLVGFMSGAGRGKPANKVSQFKAVHFSGENGRINPWVRVVDNLHKIKHWKFICGDYHSISNQVATWFIDPPYFDGGQHQYKHNNTGIDYNELSFWSQSRCGQVIVCENTKANWLDFTPIKNNPGVSLKNTTEAIWCNDVMQPRLFE